jgi:hypothetical protein
MEDVLNVYIYNTVEPRLSRTMIYMVSLNSLQILLLPETIFYGKVLRFKNWNPSKFLHISEGAIKHA